MVHSVSVELPATKDFLDRVRTASQKDQELQLLTQQVKLGWPKKISKVDDKIKCYWSFREDITVADDILVKGHRIIVPKDMRDYMLNQVHEGHFGMDKCKMHMSNCCYWPNVNKEIEEMIRNCPTCLEFAPAKPKIKKKDMLHYEVPGTPWMKLATDIFPLPRNKLPDPSRLHIKIPSSQTTAQNRPTSSNNSTRGNLHGKRLPGRTGQ